MAISAACSACSLECNYYGPLDCARDMQLLFCWFTLLATVRLAVVDKGPLWDGSTCTSRK